MHGGCGMARRRSPRGLAVGHFFVGDGTHNNVLTREELGTRVIVPAAARGQRGAYRKLRPRAAIDFPMLSIAIAARGNAARIDGLRLVVSALGARPRVVGGLDDVAVGRPPDEATFAAIAAIAH